MAHLRKPLPITFRINGSGKFAADLRDRMENDFFSQFADGPVPIIVGSQLPLTSPCRIVAQPLSAAVCDIAGC